MYGAIQGFLHSRRMDGQTVGRLVSLRVYDSIKNVLLDLLITFLCKYGKMTWSYLSWVQALNTLVGLGVYHPHKVKTVLPKALCRRISSS